MNKIKNCSIDMISAINQIFSSLESKQEINLHMSLDHNDAIIYDIPRTRKLHFSYDRKKLIHINSFQYYTNSDGDQCKFIEKKEFNIAQPSEIKNYLMTMFKL